MLWPIFLIFDFWVCCEWIGLIFCWIFLFQLERFRNRVVQSAYSSASTKTPEGEITDDQLVETLKKLVEERTEFHNKVKEMEKQLKLTDSSSNVFKRNITKLRTDLEKSIVSCHSSHLELYFFFFFFKFSPYQQ
jgi:uncharacterized protein YlxW (UPF0749 family)